MQRNTGLRVSEVLRQHYRHKFDMLTSIRNKLYVLFIVVTTAILTLFSLYDYANLSQDLNRSFTEMTSSTIARLSIGLSTPLWDFNKDAAKSIIKSEMMPAEIRSIQLFDATGQLFLSSSRDVKGNIINDKPVNAKDGIAVEAPLYRQSGEVAGSAAAVQSTQAIGRVVVNFSRHLVDEALRTNILRHLIETVAMDLLLLLLLTLSLRMVFTPLGKLRDALIDLSQNDGVKMGALPETEQNEFGEVIKAFNQVLLKRSLAEKSSNRLLEIDQALQAASDFEEFGNMLLTRLSQMLGLVYGALYIADAEETELRRVGGYGCDDSIHDRRFAWGQNLVGQAAMDKRTISMSLPVDDPFLVKIGPGTFKVHTMLILPVISRDKVLAVLEIGAQEPFEEWKTNFIVDLLPTLATKTQILAGNVALRELLVQSHAQA